MNVTEGQLKWADEQLALVRGGMAAKRAGGMETYYRIARKLEVPAETLLSFKKVWCADFVRELGFNTKCADEKYGPDWLDRAE